MNTVSPTMKVKYEVNCPTRNKMGGNKNSHRGIIVMFFEAIEAVIVRVTLNSLRVWKGTM